MDRLLHAPDYNLNKLTRTELKVYMEMKENPERFRSKNITTISNELYVSPASIIAMLKKIGFDGFSEFKIALNNYQIKNQKRETKNSIEQLQYEIMKTINALDIDELDLIIDEIKKSPKIIILTSEQSYYVAEEFYYKLLMLDFDVLLIKDYFLMKHTINQNHNSLIIVFSLFGNTSYIYENLKNINYPKIVITTNPHGILINQNDLKLIGYYGGTAKENGISQAGCDIHSRIALNIIATIIINSLLEDGEYNYQKLKQKI